MALGCLVTGEVGFRKESLASRRPTRSAKKTLARL
jgi:hypothetical protein